MIIILSQYASFYITFHSPQSARAWAHYAHSLFNFPHPSATDEAFLFEDRETTAQKF